MRYKTERIKKDLVDLEASVSELRRARDKLSDETLAPEATAELERSRTRVYELKDEVARVRDQLAMEIGACWKAEDSLRLITDSRERARARTRQMRKMHSVRVPSVSEYSEDPEDAPVASESSDEEQPERQEPRPVEPPMLIDSDSEAP